MVETYKVFVYGTLLVGESNHHIVKPYLLDVQPGKIKGRLYNKGPYPALVIDGEGKEVHGEWLTVSKDALEDLDWLEDYKEGSSNNEYERVWIKDIDGKIEGFIYIYYPEKAEGLELIKSGSWRYRQA